MSQATKLKVDAQALRQQDLIAAILADYPRATRLEVSVIRDENNRGYYMPDSWQVCRPTDYGDGKYEYVLARSDEDGEEGPFDQELNNYVDDLRVTNDFTLNLA